MLSVAYGMNGEVCYSGSTDSTIRVWRMPEEVSDDPFSIYGMLKCRVTSVLDFSRASAFCYLKRGLSSYCTWCALFQTEMSGVLYFKLFLQ